MLGTLTRREIRAHPLRTFLTSLGIVVGVAFITGILVLTATLQDQFGELFADRNANADVGITGITTFSEVYQGESDRPVPVSLLEEVANFDGVAAAEGIFGGQAAIVDANGNDVKNGSAPRVGISWPKTTSLSSFTLVAGRPPADGSEVAMDITTAENHGYSIGDDVIVITPSGLGHYELSGIVTFGVENRLLGASLIAFEYDTAATKFVGEDEEPTFQGIDVEAEPGVDPQRLADELDEILPEGFEATTSAEVAQRDADGALASLEFFRILLYIFAAIALVVSAFIINVTFSILVAQRTRDLALLRTLGMTNREVRTMVLGEAFFVGLAASIVGILAGIGLAELFRWVFNALGSELPQGNLVIQPVSIGIGLAVGVLMTIGASWWPAKRAGRVPPMAAFTGVAVGGDGHRRRTLIGAATMIIGIAVVWYSLNGNLRGDGGVRTGFSADVALMGAGALAVLIGATLLGPWLAGPITALVGAPFARFAGVTGQMARTSSQRDVHRTASTASALMIGVAVITAMVIILASIRTSTLGAIDDTISADLVVASTTRAGFTPEIGRLLGGERGEPMPSTLQGVSRVQAGQFRVDDDIHFLFAMNPRTGADMVRIDMVEGSISNLSNGALPVVLVHQSLAEQLGWNMGDIVEVEFAVAGFKDVKIGGIYENGSLFGTQSIDLVLDLSTYDRFFAYNQDIQVFLKLKPDVTESQARRQIDPILAPYPQVELLDVAEFKDSQTSVLFQILGFMGVIVLFTIAIAALGIVNTLFLSVFQRTREFGLLRVVGMEYRQVRHMVTWEAVMISSYGVLIGSILGTGLAWAVVRLLSDQGLRSFDIPAIFVVVLFALAWVVGVLAGSLPARRAAKVDMLAAVTTD
ncbi:MAG: ABC transporter permease [Actinobacteria bacterium]|nr:ABC transporter permease [Actinomycetota bacterium]MCB9388709.1 ABC transporter permease [Acidimicrobiia bacterium]